jgi:hypothetical protein
MKRLAVVSGVALMIGGASGVVAMRGRAADTIDYRVVATLRTGTMEKELNDAAGAGFRFQAVMGGETAVGGKEVVAIVSRASGGGGSRYQYKLLATNKTSTMEKELQAASDAGYEYRGQTVFDSTFGGKEVVVILEKDKEGPSGGYLYKLLATTKTSTMEKELKAIGEQGYEVLGMTVGQTAMGGKELVTITRKQGR